MAIVIGIVIDDDTVSYMGVRSYRIQRTQTRSVEVLSKPLPQRRRQSSRRGVFGRIKGFAQKLISGGLVPSSPKVQSEVLYAEQSPWRQQVRDAEVVEDIEQTETQKTTMQFSNLRLTFNYIHTYWSPYWVAGAAAVAGLITIPLNTLFIAQTIQIVTDNAVKPGGLALIRVALGRLIIVFPFLLLGMLVGERLAARLSSRVANDIRYDLLAHLQSLSINYHDDAQLGDLIDRFSTDIGWIESGFGRSLLRAAADVIVLVIYLGFMLQTSFILTVFGLLPTLITPYFIRVFAARYSDVGLEMQEQRGLVVNTAQEVIRAQPMIKSFGTEVFFQDCFGDQLKMLEDKNTEALYSLAVFRNSYETMSFAYYIITLGLGAILIANGAITAGGLLAYLAVSRDLHARLRSFTNQRLTQLIRSSVSVRRIDQILQQAIEVTDAEDATPLPAFQRALSFNHVSFSYSGEAKQLTDINLTIHANQMVAFVGPSGAGKSTIFNLIMRFYDVTEGAITIDGYDLRDVTQHSLRKQVGVVLQDTFVFNTTIFDNIRVAKPDATKAQVIAAAKSAELHEFIMSLPAGYDTMVGEAGSRISGGQKQRIAIARMMLYNPPILLLDEATSSLDAQTAQAINTTLRSIAGNRTIIMITHQLSAVVDADNIFVLENGYLVEEGTHETLLAQGGVYNQLWQSQTNGIQKGYALVRKLQEETTPDKQLGSTEAEGDMG